MKEGSPNIPLLDVTLKRKLSRVLKPYDLHIRQKANEALNPRERELPIMPCRGEIVEINRIGPQQWSVKWIIRDPLQPSGRRAYYYDSPNFSIGDVGWGLRLYPNWGKETRNPASGWLRLDLDRCDGGPPGIFHVYVGIRGSTGVEWRGEVEQEFSGRGYYNWAEFCPRFDLIYQKSRLMPEDTLTITCVIRSTVPDADTGILPSPQQPIPSDSTIQEPIVPVYRIQSSDTREDEISEAKVPIDVKQSSEIKDEEFKEYKTPVDGKQSLKNQDADFKESKVPANAATSSKQDASTQTDAEFKEARVPFDAKQSSGKQGIEKVTKDLGKLLASGYKSDVTVQVQEAEFKVHSNILYARSEVLSAMLVSETTGKASNRILISDCEVDVFGEYLRYIYTGSVQFLSQQTVFGLYRVAHEYLADDLKLLCLQHMRNTLSVQTFCDTVKLASAHGESDLLQLAIDFASKNLPLIIRSVEWQNFLRECATEANEILIKCISP